jgi:hypothetical protein
MLIIQQLLLILQLVASLLVSVQSNPSIPEETKQRAVSHGHQGVEIVTKTLSQWSIPALSSGSAPGYSGEATAPDNRSSGGLSRYPDNPLSVMPTEPITVTYLIEHRSALNGKMVRVRGVVVRTLLGEAACPSGGAGVPPGACAQPSIYLTDEGKVSREAHFDLRVLISASETGYQVGQVVVIQGTVSGHPSAVLLVKAQKRE